MGCATHGASAPTLRFSAPEGPVLNEFYRHGTVAAHLVATPGPAPRLVIAFPAGNSGAAVWFDTTSGDLSWRPDIKVQAASRILADGALLQGITAELTATGGPVRIRQALASSVRVIRGYQDTGAAPPEILVMPQRSERRIVWERRRLDGAPGYYLSIELLRGSISGGSADTGPIQLTGAAGGQLRIRVTALTGDAPLTPVNADQLLMPLAAGDARLHRSLAFLSYQEKLLAGSWRFNTYFGRDTLMSLRLLAPALQPAALEAGLLSVLERLSAAGEVAHEEDIGEFAVLRRMRAGLPASDAPLFDYTMVDDDFMLAPVAAHYLLEAPAGRARAMSFLARQTRSGSTCGALLVRNLRFVLTSAAPFARRPRWQHLVALKPGAQAGNWRDSEDGLGGGRYPYDVNGVFVPAALVAIGRLHRSGLLQPYVDDNTAGTLATAAAMAEIWLREAQPLFEVAIPSDTAHAAARSYAQQVGVDASAALAALGTKTLRFRAVALDSRGQPVPILNSDEGFGLLFLKPHPAELERIATVLLRPFPAGLLTDVGLTVANPAYAPAELAARFERTRYHGTVIWSWQQAMLAAGLDRQLSRHDLTVSARAVLAQARDRLHAAIRAAEPMRGSELWSWSMAQGRYRIEAFGQRAQDETESNAAQLWSTVHLARPGE